jgi:hypothetical protein
MIAGRVAPSVVRRNLNLPVDSARRVLAAVKRLLFAAMCVGVAPGCGGEADVACFPVRGRVTLDGKPLAEATVAFHSLATTAAIESRPLAYTDSHGCYTLTTVRQGDGAPPGQYAITVVLRAPRQVGEEIVRDGRNLLPARYARPESSGLQFEVVAGDNDIPPLALTSR